jgi:uncharacterized protein (TIGR03083 family)
MATVWDELELVWRDWGSLAAELTADEWSTDTRLPGWNVRNLYAHVAAWPPLLARLVAAEAHDAEPDWDDAGALLRYFNEPGGLARSAASSVADAARSTAAAHEPLKLSEQFTQVGLPALDAGRNDPNKVVTYLGAGTIRLADAAEIGLLEGVVHRLDLDRALQRPPTMPPSSIGRVSQLLWDLTDPVAFVEAATGRTAADEIAVVR